MRKILALAAIAGILLPPSAFAQEGTAAGVAGGAATGAVVGGPIGAIIGAVAGGVMGTAIDPPETAVTYVRTNQVQPVVLEGEVVVGARVPTDVVTLYEIPDYEYRYAYVNGVPVLLDPADGRIVYIVE
jgi:hypothetical protein